MPQIHRFFSLADLDTSNTELPNIIQSFKDSVTYSMLNPHLRGSALLCDKSIDNDVCTSLLFQYAYSVALENEHVIFITPRKRVMSFPPCIASKHLQNLDKETLKRIHMKYIDEDFEELRPFLLNAHLMYNNSQQQVTASLPTHPIPALLLLNDFSGYFVAQQDRLGAAHRCFAQVCSLASYFGSKHKAFEFVIQDQLAMQSFYERWLPCTILLKPQHQQQQDVHNDLVLFVNKVNGDVDENHTKVLFAAKQDILVKKFDYEQTQPL